MHKVSLRGGVIKKQDEEPKKGKERKVKTKTE